MTIKRALDFVLYICIALAFGFLCIWFAENHIDSKWLAVVLETCFVFGVAIVEQRESWKSPPFWIVLLIVFAVHSLVAIVVVRKMSELRGAWVSVAFVVETVAIVGLLESRVLRASRFRAHR